MLECSLSESRQWQPRHTQSPADPWGFGHSGDLSPAHSRGSEEMNMGRANPAQHV